MLDIAETLKNLMGIEVTENTEEDIICAFDTNEEVIVNKSSVGYQAYENIEGSPLIIIRVEDNIIVEAWED